MTIPGYRSGMKNTSLLVLGSGLLFALMPVACGDDTGSGGAAPSTTASETVTATTKAVSSSPASQTSSMMMCDGSYWGTTCGGCLEANCCIDLSDSGGAWSDELDTCAASACGDECFGTYNGPECGVDTALPRAGECVASGGVHDCNPLTQVPCNGTGKTCDMNYDSGKFECFDPPNEIAVCDECPADSKDGTVWCQPGLTCVLSQCTKYCCEDADCAPGTCAKGVFFGDINVGICQTGGNEGGGGTGGSGGSGGAGGAGGGPAGGGGAGGN